MDSQPQNPNLRHRLSPQSHKQQRNMDKLRKAVLGAMALDSTTPLSEETKNSIEIRLLQLFPIIRTPDHPPYAAMILKAIEALNEERGSSEKSMAAFIESNYEVPWAHSSYLSHHLCKLVQNGDIIVTSDNHYMIPTENPSPRPKPKQGKRQKRKRRQGRGGRLGDYYHGEAVVEVENLARELELVETKDSSQSQEHKNYVIDERKEQDSQVNEGKDRSLQLQDEEDLTALMIMPVESLSPRVEDKEEETVEELQNQPKSCVILFDSMTPLNPQDNIEKQQLESQQQDIASIEELDKDTLPLGPPEHTPARRRGRGRPPKTVPGTITRDEPSLPLHLESYRQHPPESLLSLGPAEHTPSRGRGRGRPRKTIPDTITRHGAPSDLHHESYRQHPPESLLSLGPAEHTPSRGRGRGRLRKTIPDTITRHGASSHLHHESYQQQPPQPLLSLGPPERKPHWYRGGGRPPKTIPDTITRDEASLPLQHESYQQHPPPCRRGRGRPPKTTSDSITRDEASLPLQHESYQQHPPESLLPFGHLNTHRPTLETDRGRGRPPKTTPNSITRDEATLPLQYESYQHHTPQKRGRGRPRKSKPDVDIIYLSE